VFLFISEKDSRMYAVFVIFDTTGLLVLVTSPVILHCFTPCVGQAGVVYDTRDLTKILITAVNPDWTSAPQ
jgi:hypothetical protein